MVCSALPSPARLSVSNRDYFREAIRTGDFTVGEYQAKRITGKSSISFAYPVKDAASGPTAVAIAALDLERLASVAERTLTLLPPGSTFTVLDHDGTVIGRRPDGEGFVGEPLTDRALLAKVLSSKLGTERTETPLGAVLHAFAPVRDPLRRDEWYTVMSLPEGVLFAPLNRSFRNSLLMLGSALVIAAVMGRLVAQLLVLRPTARIIEATRLMAAGDLEKRIGPDYAAGELGELARSFDGMADALGQRQSEASENQERLAAMSRRVLGAQEDERRRIARELHDDLGQLLTGAKINLVSLQGGTAHPQPGFDPLDDTLDLVGRAITSVRELSTELRPAVLDDGGLAEALEWLLGRTSLRAGFEGHFEVEPLGSDVPPEIETTLFRFAQEALTNVARHAVATKVSMSLRRRGSALALTISDNGDGFDADAAHQRAVEGKSMGVLGMEERITLAGGRLEIESTRGHGATLRAIVPLDGDLDEEWQSEAVCC